MDKVDTEKSSEAPTEMHDPDIYRLKKIRFNDKIVNICMQNENGPCPLLAISNILLLRGDMYIHPDHSHVTLAELLNQISNYIIQRKPKTFADDSERFNYEANIAASMSMLEELAKGLDVNVKFSNVLGFEFTVQCGIFDLVGIALCHGWIPDPNDKAYSFLSPLSYNQLTEKLVMASIAEEHSKTLTNEQSSIENASSETSSISPPQSQKSDSSTELSLAKQWLDEHASQLTFFGLTKLHEIIAEDQLCVCFRNNHFSTLLKRNGHLWLLVTDQGYTHQSAIVWEKFDSVDGDSQFVNSLFQPFTGLPTDYSNLIDIHDDNQIQKDGNHDQQTKLDQELAMQLQEAEHRAAAREAQREAQRQQLESSSSDDDDDEDSSSEDAQHRRPKSNKRPVNDPRDARQSQTRRTEARPARPSNNKKSKKDDDDCIIL